MSGAVLHTADVITTSPANVFKKKNISGPSMKRMLVHTGCSELAFSLGTNAPHEIKGSQCGVDSRRSVARCSAARNKHEDRQLSGLNVWTRCGHDNVASLCEQTLLIFGSTSRNLECSSVIPEHATLLSWTGSSTQASLARCVLQQTPI